MRRRLLRLRVGIGHTPEHALEEIGGRFALTRERIRQIDASALLKLQRLTGRDGLRTLLSASCPGLHAGGGRHLQPTWSRRLV